ncbi:MAG: NAD/NADP octopine/nopaline dehydrogenase family protein [Prevotella sp.]|nr:NAD/NADP octopine/nopaline dehydrogenase family protein [Prevotella sp.]
MKVCICGGGNLGHVVAGFVAARQGFEVSMLTRHPEQWGRQLVIDCPDGTLTAELALVSDDVELTVGQADMVLLCLPGFAIRQALLHIRSGLKPGTAVGSVVSSTGFFLQAMEVLQPQVPLFGLQRVPFIARVEEYGHRARLMGYKSSLSMAVEHTTDGEQLRKEVEHMLGTPTKLLSNFYEVSLSNSNPLLHPSRLYDLWGQWQPGQVSTRVPLFYEEWTERAAEIYLALDAELQQLLQVLPVRKGSIPSVLDYYESTDAASLAAKLRSIEAFKGIKSPMKAVEGGYVPDFQSRYFTEDFPYGLALVQRLARQHGVNTPTTDELCRWGMDKTALTS